MKITPVADVIKMNKMRWYDNAMRKEGDHAINMTKMSGRRPSGRDYIGKVYSFI